MNKDSSAMVGDSLPLSEAPQQQKQKPTGKDKRLSDYHGTDAWQKDLKPLLEERIRTLESMDGFLSGGEDIETVGKQVFINKGAAAILKDIIQEVESRGTPAS